jgi:putative Ca2+/H+ antiporter (TMEM165/GDT1 family)
MRDVRTRVISNTTDAERQGFVLYCGIGDTTNLISVNLFLLNTTRITIGAGTAYASRTNEFTPVIGNQMRDVRTRVISNTTDAERQG